MNKSLSLKNVSILTGEIDPLLACSMCYVLSNIGPFSWLAAKWGSHYPVAGDVKGLLLLML